MSSAIAPARVFFGAILSLLLAASSLLVLSSGSVSTASASAPAPSDANCQNTAPLGMAGTWACSFDDEFNGTSLDTTKWTPQLTANSGYTTGTASGWPCYVNNPSTISESGGYLDLSVVQEAAPISCADGYSTPFEAGMVSTYGKFNQTYGAFEVNAELPPSVAKGLQETFWLYPQTLTDGAWPHSGEIDVAEFYSQYPTLDVPYIHYTEAASGDPNVTAYNCTINQGGFNTYGIDWQPGTLTIYLNGNVCLVDHPNPAAPLISPQPFNDPFFLALTQALGSTTDAYVPGTTQLPATTLVDWVRAWTANTNTYGVTYQGNGAMGVGNVPVDPNSYTAGGTVSVLGNTGDLVNTGYSFDDWNTAANGSGTSYAPGDTFVMPAANVTLYAIWTANVSDAYSYAPGSGSGSAPAPGSGLDGTTVTLAANTFSDPGHTFAGWSDGSVTYAAGATYTLASGGTPIVLTAQWTPINDAYSYAPGSGSGSAPAPGSGLDGTTVTLAANTFSDPGHTFAGWSDGSVTYAAGATYTLASGGTPIVLTAQWTPINDAYSYAPGSGSGSAPAPGSGLDGTTVTLAANTFSDPGHTFAGWSDGSVTYAAGATYTLASGGTPIVLTAQWTPINDAYSYAPGSGSGSAPAPGSGLDGTTVTLAANTFSDPGHTFAGWSDGSVTYAAGATYTLASGGTPIVLTAQWTPISDAYSYAPGSGSGSAPAPGSGLDGTTVTLAANTFSDPGHTFAGWSDGSVTYAAGATYTLASGGTPIVLTAQWTPINDAYSYAPGSGSGSAPAPGSGLDGTTVTLAANTFSDPGHTFAGWSDGSVTYAAGATYTLASGGTPIVLTAQWTPINDAYSYAPGSGSGSAPAPGSGLDGTTVTLAANTFSDPGHTFAGWSDGSVTYAAGATYTLASGGTPIVLTAQWTPIVYTVTYNYESGMGSPASANFTAGGSALTLPTPTRTGYTFAGWYTGASSGTLVGVGGASYSPTASLTIYAGWTANALPEKTTTGLSLSKTSVTYGAETSETFTVTVTGQPGDGYPEGTVTVYNSSTKLCSQTLVEKSTDSATATCSLTALELSVGSYGDVFATYTPSTTSSSNTGYTYTASTFTPATRLSVTADTTTTKVSASPTKVTRGNESAAVFTVTVTTHNGEAVPTGDQVTVKVGSATCTATLNAGTGTCTIAKSALPVGSYSVSATYAGDANLSGSSGTSATKLTVTG